MSVENGKKIIPEDEYNLKLCFCSRSALYSAVLTGVATVIAVPLIVRSLRIRGMSIELSIVAGFVSAVPVSSYFAKRKRLNCTEDVKNTYRY